MNSDDRREINEAIQAANDALCHLEASNDCLKSAGNWGVVDLLGGGFFSTLMKHGKMDHAQDELFEAKTALRRFATELQDIRQIEDIHLEVDDFLTFADFFFDGVIADWLMQKRIDEAKQQVTDAIIKVRDIRSRLQNIL